MYYHHYGLPVTVFGIECIFSSWKELGDYANIHVVDVVGAFLFATLNARAQGQVFNLVYPAPHISVREIAEALG
jgi:nucleoside-diphosphate-sugar epimerase